MMTSLTSGVLRNRLGNLALGHARNQVHVTESRMGAGKRPQDVFNPKTGHLSQRESEHLQVPAGNQSRIKAEPTASSAWRVRHRLSNPMLPSETNKLYPPNVLVEIFYLSTRPRKISGGTRRGLHTLSYTTEAKYGYRWLCSSVYVIIQRNFTELLLCAQQRNTTH